ncbi:MAG: hypothetical protein IJP67_02870 [Oscillospiraceae bacterium]|nr:hypothetical protein [Oscillospiraceae bacterium]
MLNDLFYAVLAAGAHELGHIAAIYALGGRVERFTADPGGLNIRYCGGFSPAQDALIALAGPAMNLVMAVLSAFFGFFGGYFIGINLVFCIFNLIPISILDGGRIIAPYLGARALYLDIALITALFILGLFIWRAAGNPTMVVASFMMLFLCLQNRRY